MPKLTRIALFSVTIVCASPGQAHALRGVIFGGGEAVSVVADLDPTLVDEVQREGITEPAIGYLYGYFSLLFLDLFTFEGRYVLMDKGTEQFVKLDNDELARLAGKPIEQLGKPFLYRFPLGGTLILLVVFGFCVRLYFGYREQFGQKSAPRKRK